MLIKQLKKNEIPAALFLIEEVFEEMKSPTYLQEGIDTFRKIIEPTPANTLLMSNKLLFWGAYCDNKLNGVIALNGMGHITLLFVCSQNQKKGIGRMLVQEAYHYSQQVLHLNKMTVHSIPSALQAYLCMGFVITGEQQITSGIRYIPMKLKFDICKDVCVIK